MDLSLAYLYMTADLNGFGRLLFQESPQMVDAGTEKRNGVTYRLLELRGSKDRHLVRLYILPNRLVAGMYTETESNTAEETPGGRVAKREWTTGLTFLRDIRIDKPVSETAFDFNKRPDTLVEKQSPMLIAGNQAPDFDVINPMDDKHISLSNLLQGKNAVLVNFWFSGCAPCREEFPHLQNLYNEFKDKGFDMIALDGSWADGSKVIRSFLTKNHYTFRAGLALHTQKRLEADDIAWRYGVQSYPSSFLVGANGRILWSGVGYDEKALRNALALAGLN
jgi:thiol-disulfide isomerase/thioredoxin